MATVWKRSGLKEDAGRFRWFGRGPILAELVPDGRWPGMYRVKTPDGRLSDMANISWAREAAKVIALRRKETAPGVRTATQSREGYPDPSGTEIDLGTGSHAHFESSSVTQPGPAQ
jgi:hypothetical protein